MSLTGLRNLVIQKLLAKVLPPAYYAPVAFMIIRMVLYRENIYSNSWSAGLLRRPTNIYLPLWVGLPREKLTGENDENIIGHTERRIGCVFTGVFTSMLNGQRQGL